MMTKRIRLPEPFTARSRLRARKGHGAGTALVPAIVRDKLGARPGDTLVFQEGCDRSVMLAALRGRYFVVRIERAKEKCAVESAITAEGEDSTLGESFSESVQRKLEER